MAMVTILVPVPASAVQPVVDLLNIGNAITVVKKIGFWCAIHADDIQSLKINFALIRSGIDDVYTNAFQWNLERVQSVPWSRKL